MASKKKNGRFDATVGGHVYEFLHDPATISVYQITRQHQPHGDLLDTTQMIMPQNATKREMIEQFEQHLDCGFSR